MALRQLESLHHHALREGLVLVALGAALEPGVRAGAARPTREAA
jgi:hypothetical protein